MTIGTPTDRPKSVRNRCLIDVFLWSETSSYALFWQENVDFDAPGMQVTLRRLHDFDENQQLLAIARPNRSAFKGSYCHAKY